jgi:hypothetical protein
MDGLKAVFPEGSGMDRYFMSLYYITLYHVMSSQVMVGLKAVFPEGSVKDRLTEDHPLPLADIAAATLTVLRSRFYFADHDDLQATMHI